MPTPNKEQKKSFKKTIVPAQIPSPVKAYTSNIGRTRVPGLQWESPEWDLAECGRIIDVESFVRRAFRNKKNLFLKEGYEFTGANPERVKYIEERIHQIEEATGIPFPLLVSQSIGSLIRCSNAFLVKVRDSERSGGKERILGTKLLKPVAGYFPVPAETIRFKRDEFGTIKKIRQYVPGKNEIEWNPEDVVHFYLDKREGFAVGTPSIVAVKDDIRALRRIEENVELLVYQHLFPLFHYKVGTESAPADILADGRTEIDVVRASIEAMPTDGCWVTPERHEIKVLGAEGNALAVDKIIEHFKQRIFTGLGQSSVDMGEGGTANRSTASTMSRNLIDDTKADQRDFGAQFYALIIRELLLESTFDQETLFKEENKVFLKFKEIDLESRIAKENHYVDMYLKNAITHPEMRIAMGYKPFEGEGWPTANSKAKMFTKGDGDYSNTNYGLFERDRIVLQSIDEPGTDEAKTTAASTANKNNSLASESKSSSVANKNKPENQHGVRTAPKLNKDFIDSIPESLDVIRKQELPFQSYFLNLKNDVITYVRTRGARINEIDNLLNIGFSTARDRLINASRRAYRIGLLETNTQIYSVKSEVADALIQNHIERYVIKLKENIITTIKDNITGSSLLKKEDASLIESIFNAYEHRSKMIDFSEIMKAYNYGLASGYRVNGFKTLISKRINSTICNICDNQALSYDRSGVIIYEELPPLHPLCTCVVEKVN